MVTRRNKWLRGTSMFGLMPLPHELGHAEGILPFNMVVDPAVGSETVLLLLDRSPFIDDLAQVRPFDLRLKTGIVRTAHGPLLFLLFYVTDPRQEGAVLLAIDAHVNPHEPQHMDAWRELARQSHWHLILVGENDKLVHSFEFENDFGLDQTLAAVEDLSGTPSRGSFDAAKTEFCATYSIDHLLQM